MRTIFEFREIEVGRLAWASIGGAYAEHCDAAARESGGALYGVWAGQIGLDRDQGIVMTAWHDLASAKRAGPQVTTMDGVTVGCPVYLESTVRPRADEQPDATGFYAHRWFELSEADWPEFLELSDEAWPSMEESVDATILGFWRALEGRDGTPLRVLLLTHYATLNDWERSRWWGRPDPSAHDAMERFRRRTQLVERSRVLISTLPAERVRR